MVGGVRGVESKNNSGFELCCPFLTSTPSFIQIGPKLAKLVFWGGSGGYGVEWLEGLGRSNIKIHLDLSFAVHSLLPHQVSSKSDQNWQSYYFEVGELGGSGRMNKISLALSFALHL